MGQSDVRQNTNTEAHGKLFAEAHEWGRSLIQSERLCLGSQPGNHRNPKAEQPKATKANATSQPNQATGKAATRRARQDTTRTNPQSTNSRGHSLPWMLACRHINAW
jgi:hypothetical protein